MVTKQKFMEGIVTYLDNDVIPKLPQNGKIGVYTISIYASLKGDQLFESIKCNPYVKALGCIDDKDMVDIDGLSQALTQALSKFGPWTLTLPVIGTMRFTSDDVTKLVSYIDGGTYDGRTA